MSTPVLWPVSGLHHHCPAQYRARPLMWHKVILWFRMLVRLVSQTSIGGQAPERPWLETNLILTASPLKTQTRGQNSSLTEIFKDSLVNFFHILQPCPACFNDFYAYSSFISFFFSSENLNSPSFCYSVLWYKSKLGSWWVWKLNMRGIALVFLIGNTFGNRFSETILPSN